MRQGIFIFLVTQLLAYGSLPLDFSTTIVPLLTKSGCNAGACHGAATGQGGFKLSLLGYDPEEDWFRITREFEGRRTDVDHPENSLLLKKASRQMNHEGGRRIARESEFYRILEEWIRGGAKHGKNDVRPTRLIVSPKEIFSHITETEIGLKVISEFSDGTTRDVTPLVLFDSNNEPVADVSGKGNVRLLSPGLASIMIRYAGEVASVRVAIPFGPPSSFEERFTSRNFIDQELEKEWRKMGLTPAAMAPDHSFLRRVHLDIAGRLPPSREARAFLNSPSSYEKRMEEVDRLLRSDAFSDFWTLQMSDLLLLGVKGGSERAARTYHDWLRQQIKNGVSYKTWAGQLLTATGSMEETGPANFFNLASDPRDMIEQVGRIFMGVQLGCARCHAHPTDRWTQKDYYQLAANFAQVEKSGGSVRLNSRLLLEDPKKGTPVAPHPFDSGEKDPRVSFYRWLTAPENRHFSEAFVNRVWKHFFGKGLVDPVEDLRPTNPPSHPELLNKLAEYFVSKEYDLKALIRVIVESNAYQLSSLAPRNQVDEHFFSHATVRPLTGQILVDAICDVTEVPEQFPGYPGGTRAVHLISPATPSYSLDVLGRCGRETTCETSSASGGGMSAALHLLNGPLVLFKTAAGLKNIRKPGKTFEEAVEEIYLRAFSRPPRGEELNTWASMRQESASEDEFLSDLLWALLNSREFVMNH